MQIPFSRHAIALIFMLGWLGTSQASLTDDNQALEQKWHELDQQLTQARTELNGVVVRRRSAERDHRRCANGAWQVFWQPRIEQGEKARRELEDQNAKLVQLRAALRKEKADLDNRRGQIERSHSDKAEDSAYEQEFRRYLADFENLYDKESDVLLEGYREYINGIAAYVDFINTSAQFCRDRNFSQGAIDLAAKHVDKIVGAANSIVGLLDRVKALLAGASNKPLQRAGG